MTPTESWPRPHPPEAAARQEAIPPDAIPKERAMTTKPSPERPRFGADDLSLPDELRLRPRRPAVAPRRQAPPPARPRRRGPVRARPAPGAAPYRAARPQEVRFRLQGHQPPRDADLAGAARWSRSGKPGATP